jgi:hypothetical protein
MTDKRCERCSEKKVVISNIIHAGHGDRYQVRKCLMFHGHFLYYFSDTRWIDFGGGKTNGSVYVAVEGILQIVSFFFIICRLQTTRSCILSCSPWSQSKTPFGVAPAPASPLAPQANRVESHQTVSCRGALLAHKARSWSCFHVWTQPGKLALLEVLWLWQWSTCGGAAPNGP